MKATPVVSRSKFDVEQPLLGEQGEGLVVTNSGMCVWTPK